MSSVARRPVSTAGDRRARRLRWIWNYATRCRRWRQTTHLRSGGYLSLSYAADSGWWGDPPGPRGTPRPAAGSGGRGLLVSDGARPTRLHPGRPHDSRGYLIGVHLLTRNL